MTFVRVMDLLVLALARHATRPDAKTLADVKRYLTEIEPGLTPAPLRNRRQGRDTRTPRDRDAGGDRPAA